MARIVFSDATTFLRWVLENATPERYLAYITSEREVVLYPRKATRPLTYAYIRTSEKEVSDIKNTLLSKELDVFEVERIEWDVEKSVGVRVSIE
jgi:hypothetical protein